MLGESGIKPENGAVKKLEAGKVNISKRKIMSYSRRADLLLLRVLAELDLPKLAQVGAG